MDYQLGKDMGNITAPATPEAVLWDGYGTALKPAAEHWIIAMKPCEGTYAQNAFKWGVAGLNIDGGRIEGTPESKVYDIKRVGYKNGKKHITKANTNLTPNIPIIKRQDSQVIAHIDKGRFPANLILDEESAKVMDEQSGVLRQGNPNQQVNASSIYGSNSKRNNKTVFATTYASASRFFKTLPAEPCRFFYCPKASKKERNRGCEGLEAKEQGRGTSRKCANCGKPIVGLSQDKKCTCNNRIEQHTKLQNHHPTIKPLALMEYLCTLTRTPIGGSVLDPFMGSGTTGIACKNTGRDFIGIEKDPEYFKIAKARIEYEEKQAQIKIDF